MHIFSNIYSRLPLDFVSKYGLSYFVMTSVWLVFYSFLSFFLIMLLLHDLGKFENKANMQSRNPSQSFWSNCNAALALLSY